MSGVWVFKNGVVKLAQNPPPEPEGTGTGTRKRKALVHTKSGQVVSSYESLESMLVELDWQRYYDDDSLLQFGKRGGLGTISLPKDFARFRSEHMYDIVLKNRDAFRVIDAAPDAAP